MKCRLIFILLKVNRLCKLVLQAADELLYNLVAIVEIISEAKRVCLLLDFRILVGALVIGRLTAVC